MTLNELDVLKATGYEYPENISLLNVPVIVCGGEDSIYGQIFITSYGWQDYASGEKWAKKFLDYFLTGPYSTELGKQVVDLEKAIDENPKAFDPSSGKSIFDVYNGIEVVPAYDNRVSLIMETKGITKLRFSNLLDIFSNRKEVLD
jgi:hypothetical protein